MAIIKNCEICGREFVYNPSTHVHTCSRACWAEWRKAPVTEIECAHPDCHNVFEVRTNRKKQKKFCSKACITQDASDKKPNAGRRRKCEECGKPTGNRHNRFCSPECKNSLTQRKKLSVAVKRGKEIQNEKRLEAEKGSAIENISHDARRNRVLEEQNHRCGECEIADWNGKPLSFELEHKDGDHSNNIRDNLIILCPNCHSQTLTWRGRNKGKSRLISDEEIIEAIKNSVSIRQALVSLGLAAKGGNYKRANRLNELIIAQNSTL